MKDLPITAFQAGYVYQVTYTVGSTVVLDDEGLFTMYKVLDTDR